jgi:3-oxoacyl-[acyl-carrier protein] reductase
MVKDHMTAIYDMTLKGIPMGRMGSADEVARAIAFVASPACRFMTGTNVVIDGGFTKRVQY